MALGDVVVGQFKGVRLDRDPRDLADDELAWCKDFYPDKAGQLRMLPGVETVETLSDNDDRKLFFLTDKSGGESLFFWQSGVLAPVADVSNRFMEAPGPNVVSAPLTRPHGVNYNSKLYLFAQDATRKVQFDDNTISTAGTPGAISVNITGFAWPWPPPRTAALFRDRFALAGFDSPDESTIYWTEIGDIESPVQVTKAAFVGKGDGDRIIALRAVTIEGGSEAFEPYLLVFKRKSVWMIKGTPPTTTTPADEINLNIIPLLKKDGLVHPEALCDTPHGLMWCSGTQVWLMPTGKQPVPVGQAITARLKQAVDAGRWNAEFYDGFFRLTIPTYDNNVQEVGAFPAGSTGIAEQWWMDMREYPERISWWGPHGLPLVHQLTVKVSERSEQLYVVTRNSVSRFEGSETGHYKPEIRTKDFHFGDPRLWKIIDSIDLQLAKFGGPPAFWDAELLADGKIVEHVDQLSQQARGIALDMTSVAQLGTAAFQETTENVSHKPGNGKRFLCHSLQIYLKYNILNPTGDSAVVRELALRIRPIGRRP